jgi:uncharacterized membrane protein YgcG
VPYFASNITLVPICKSSRTKRKTKCIPFPVYLPKQSYLTAILNVTRSSQYVGGGFVFSEVPIQDACQPIGVKWDRESQSITLSMSSTEYLEALAHKVEGVENSKKKTWSMSCEKLAEFFDLHGSVGKAYKDKFFTSSFVDSLDKIKVARGMIADEVLTKSIKRMASAIQSKSWVTLSLLCAQLHRAREKQVPLQETEEKGEDEQMPLPYTSSMSFVAKTRDRFTNGGRAVLSSGAMVTLKGYPGPVVGCPKTLAMLIVKEVPFSESEKEAIKNGPKKFPGASYVTKKDGEKIWIPEDGVPDDEMKKFTRNVQLVGRHLKDGDLVGLTRSPVNSPHNHMMFRIKIVEGYCIRPHDTVLSAYDADFDGDAMIMYVPLDLVAAQQWMKSTPGRLLKYQSGKCAMECILDGKLGLLLGGEVDFTVMCAVISRLPCVKMSTIETKEFYTINELMEICLSASSPLIQSQQLKRFAPVDGSPKEVNKSVTSVRLHFGPEVAAAFLFGLQNIGSELTHQKRLKAFSVSDFIAPPVLYMAQRSFLKILESVLAKVVKEDDQTLQSFRRDLHEVVVEFSQTFAGRSPYGYNETLLGQFATAGEVLLDDTLAASEKSKRLCQLRTDLTSHKPAEVTYLIEDVNHTVKTVLAALYLTTGIIQGSVSSAARECAEARTPSDQSSFVLHDRMSWTVSSMGQTIQTVHGVNGLMGKASIETTGKLRNNVAEAMRDTRRDEDGSFRGKLIDRNGTRIQLLNASNVPASLWMDPVTIISPKADFARSVTTDFLPYDEMERPAFSRAPAERESEFLPCDASAMPSLALADRKKSSSGSSSSADSSSDSSSESSSNSSSSSGGRSVIRPDAKKRKTIPSQEPLGCNQMEEADYPSDFGNKFLNKLFAHKTDLKLESRKTTRLSSEQCLRDYSGGNLPVLHMSLLNKWPLEKKDILRIRSSTCKHCYGEMVFKEDDLQLVCSDCAKEDESTENALLAIDLSKSATIPIEGAPSEKTCQYCQGTVVLKRLLHVTSGDIEENYRCLKCYAEEPFLAEGHQKHIRAFGPNATSTFLRVELDVDALLVLGYTEMEEFELMQKLDNIQGSGSLRHAVIKWGKTSVVCASKVVVVHVICNTPVVHMTNLRKHHFGYRGLEVRCIKKMPSGRQVVTLSGIGLTSTFSTMKHLMRQAPSDTKVCIAEDYPACLALQGPEAVERQMVDDHAGEDVGMAGPARVLAAVRTATGEALACKNHTGCSWKLIGSAKEKAFMHIDTNGAKEETEDMQGADRWLGRLDDIGVVAVRLWECPNTSTAFSLRAENFNRRPLPDILPDLLSDVNSSLTFEEKSKCIGVRALQILMSRTDIASPELHAGQELKEGKIPFYVYRAKWDALVDIRCMHLREW